MERTQQLGTKSITSLLIQYSVPAIIGMVVNALYNVVDRMFIGNIPGVGAIAIAGVGVSLPIMFIVLAFGMLTGIGTTANISLELGRGSRQKAEQTLGNGFILSILFAIMITFLISITLDPLLFLFGASEATLPYAKEYVQILVYGSIFNILGFGMNATIRADGNPKLSAIYMIIGCVVNIILDYVFIFIFNWGIKGAAYATVISQAVTTLLVLYYYFVGPSKLKLKKKYFTLRREIVKSIVGIGLSPFSMQIASSFVMLFMNYSLKKYGGDVAIGAMTVIQSVSMFFLMPIFGINQGMQPIVGFNYGAKNYLRVKDTVIKCIVASTILFIGGFLIIQMNPELLVRLFTTDEALVDMAIEGMKIFMSVLPIIGLAIIGANYFQCVGKAKVAMVLSLLRQVIVLIPIVLLLPLKFGLTGIWLAGPISDVIATVITAILLYRELTKKHTIGEQKQVS